MFKRQQSHQPRSRYVWTSLQQNWQRWQCFGVTAALFVLAGLLLPLLMSCAQEEKEAPAPRARRTGTGTTQTTAKPKTDPGSVVAVIETAKGNIEFEFRADVAPETSHNFIKNAKLGNYKNEKFHRVEPLLIQAGSRFVVNETLPIENGSQKMERGIVAMAKEAGASVADASQFFICRDTTLVDSDYTVFGTVISGIDVVDKIVKDDAITNITIRDKAE